MGSFVITSTFERCFSLYNFAGCKKKKDTLNSNIGKSWCNLTENQFKINKKQKKISLFVNNSFYFWFERMCVCFVLVRIELCVFPFNHTCLLITIITGLIDISVNLFLFISFRPLLISKACVTIQKHILHLY